MKNIPKKKKIQINLHKITDLMKYLRKIIKLQNPIFMEGQGTDSASVTILHHFQTFISKSLNSSKKQLSISTSTSLQALVFDCSGVILEFEHLHYQAYNDAFAHFNVRYPSSFDESQQPLNQGINFYDQLQNRIEEICSGPLVLLPWCLFLLFLKFNLYLDFKFWVLQS